jgi:hypothetical protein
MKVTIEFTHPEDELHGDTVVQAMIEVLELYIKEKGHYSNYNPEEWSISGSWEYVSGW